MNAPAIGLGCVIHWSDYQFADGETANKYLVILGAKNGVNYLAVIATSQPKRRKFAAGCHHEAGYFHIPATKDNFPKDTWLLLAEPREINPAELIKGGFTKKIVAAYQLRGELANAIKNCMKMCKDVSAYHLSLL